MFVLHYINASINIYIARIRALIFLILNTYNKYRQVYKNIHFQMQTLYYFILLSRFHLIALYRFARLFYAFIYIEYYFVHIASLLRVFYIYSHIVKNKA